MGQLSLLTEGGARSSLRSTRARHGPTIPAYRGRCKELPQVYQSMAWANYAYLPKVVQGAPSGPPEHGMGQLSLLTEGGARSSLRSTRAWHGPTMPTYRRWCKELPQVHQSTAWANYPCLPRAVQGAPSGPPEHGMGQLSLLTEGGARSSLRSTRARHRPTIPAYRGWCKELPQVHQSTAWANYPCLLRVVQGAPSGPPEHGMGQLSLLTEGGARSSLRSTLARQRPIIPAYRRRCKELPKVH